MDSIVLYTSPFLISFLLFIIIIPPLKKIAQRYSLLDIPDKKRKIHPHPVPRIGGIALFFSVILAYFYYSYHYDVKLFFGWGVIIGLSIIFIFGLIDDRFSLSPGYKFLGQLLACLFAVLFGGVRIASFGEFLPGLEISLGYLSIPVTIFLIAGIINAVNMSDGLDGLTGGICILTFFGILILSNEVGHQSIGLFSVCILGALFGFLRYNTFPANIFLGDSGSQVLGFCLSIGAIQLIHQDPVLPPFLLFFILGFPLIDVFMVCRDRIQHGRSPFLADRSHFHFKLLQKGIKHKGSVVIIYILQTLFILFAFLMRFQKNIFIFWSYMIFMTMILMVYLLTTFHFQHYIFDYFPFLRHPFQGRRIGIIKRTDLAQIALRCLTILVPPFFLISPLLIKDIPDHIFIYSFLFFELILFLILFKIRQKEFVIKLGAYFVGATLLYFLEFTHVVSIMPWYNIYFKLIIFLLLLFIAGANELLPLGPLDYLVFFFLIIVPNLPFSFMEGLQMGSFLFKLFALFYALELIDFKKKIIPIQFSTVIALGLLSFNYVLNYIF